LVGAGGAAAVDGGELAQPLALQAVQQPPQPQHALGQGGVGQPVPVLGGEVVHYRLQGRHWSGGLPGGRSRPWCEHLFGFMAATDQLPA
jgi:hypothetical protein